MEKEFGKEEMDYLIPIMGNIKMIRNKDMVFKYGLMEIIMRDHSLMI